jgi:hypothetical protein
VISDLIANVTDQDHPKNLPAIQKTQSDRNPVLINNQSPASGGKNTRSTDYNRFFVTGYFHAEQILCSASANIQGDDLKSVLEISTRICGVNNKLLLLETC